MNLKILAASAAAAAQSARRRPLTSDVYREHKVAAVSVPSLMDSPYRRVSAVRFAESDLDFVRAGREEPE